MSGEEKNEKGGLAWIMGWNMTKSINKATIYMRKASSGGHYMN